MQGHSPTFLLENVSCLPMFFLSPAYLSMCWVPAMESLSLACRYRGNKLRLTLADMAWMGDRLAAPAVVQAIVMARVLGKGTKPSRRRAKKRRTIV